MCRNKRLFEKLKASIEAMEQNSLEVHKAITDFIKDNNHPSKEHCLKYLEYIEELHGILTIFFKQNEESEFNRNADNSDRR